MNRIHNLDYLRGLAAFGIMIYHYLYAVFGKFDSESIFGRIGLYGVSIFYVLSGLTLYLVYKNKMDFSYNQIRNFFIKRFFRIFPLMWLAIILTIIFINRDIPSYWNLFLNLSGLFGIFNWDTYFAMGLWSIGNELVFYLFFIPILFLAQKKKILFLFTYLIIFVIYLYFAFSVFEKNSPEKFTIVNMWGDYVNPLNQLFLFISGIMLGYIFESKKIENNKINITILIIGLLIFIFYPENGNPINLVSEYSRLIFSFSSIIICYGFYSVKFHLPNIISNNLIFLGTVSYSIYLLHPLVFHLVRHIVDYISAQFKELPYFTTVIISIIATIWISNFTFKYFESYWNKFGNNRFIR